jgi:hypothetical protein
MNYLTQHLLEAIEINKVRKPLYSKLSKGKSKKISNSLIFTEYLSLITSYPLDNIAKYWQNRGVPFFEHEFIPMDQVRSFQETFDDTSGITDKFPELDTLGIKKDLAASLKTNDYGEILLKCERLLQEMNIYSKHLCTVRHLIESVGRSAFLTIKHLETAKQENVRSPQFLCNYMLNSQINIIHSAKMLDKWAFPLQKDGLPIIYQDVPHIPLRIDNY